MGACCWLGQGATPHLAKMNGESRRRYKPAVIVGRSDNPLLVEQSEMITYGSRGRHGIMTITTPLHLAVLSELDSQAPQSPANLNLRGTAGKYCRKTKGST